MCALTDCKPSLTSMTFQSIWEQLTRKDPRLTDPETKVEFTAENLRRLLRQVYEQGEKQGQGRGGSGLFDSFFT